MLEVDSPEVRPRAQLRSRDQADRVGTTSTRLSTTSRTRSMKSSNFPRRLLRQLRQPPPALHRRPSSSGQRRRRAPTSSTTRSRCRTRSRAFPTWTPGSSSSFGDSSTASAPRTSELRLSGDQGGHTADRSSLSSRSDVGFVRGCCFAGVCRRGRC